MYTAPVIFQQVEEMNEAFGNPKGTPFELLRDAPEASVAALVRLRSQCANIGHEFNELETAVKHNNMLEIRDALCDILVFTYGAFHFIGALPASLQVVRDAVDLVPENKDVLAGSSVVSFLSPALEIGEDQTIIAALNCIVAYVMRAYRDIGHDVEADMQAVYDSNMSKFCANEDDLNKTGDKYTDLGVEFHVEGEFPHKCLKSSKEQTDLTGERYPKGKFLKGIRFRKPVFA